LIFPLKTVIFHSYVSLPEGNTTVVSAKLTRGHDTNPFPDRDADQVWDGCGVQRPHHARVHRADHTWWMKFSHDMFSLQNGVA